MKIVYVSIIIVAAVLVGSFVLLSPPPSSPPSLLKSFTTNQVLGGGLGQLMNRTGTGTWQLMKHDGIQAEYFDVKFTQTDGEIEVELQAIRLIHESESIIQNMQILRKLDDVEVLDEYELVKETDQDGYVQNIKLKVKFDEANYLQFGVDSTVFVYQELNKLEYNLDWANINMTLMKNVSGEFMSQINDVWVFVDSETLKFGANDSTNEGIEQYTYVLESDRPFARKGNSFTVSNPKATYSTMTNTYHEAHEFVFDDICMEDKGTNEIEPIENGVSRNINNTNPETGDHISVTIDVMVRDGSRFYLFDEIYPEEFVLVDGDGLILSEGNHLKYVDIVAENRTWTYVLEVPDIPNGAYDFGGQWSFDVTGTGGFMGHQNINKILNSNCLFKQSELNGKYYLNISFLSGMFIDPTITIGEDVVSSTSLLTNVTAETNYTHLPLVNLDRQIGQPITRRTESIVSFDDSNSLAYFDGVGDFIKNWDESASLEFNEWTISAWFSRNSPGSVWATVIRHGDDTNSPQLHKYSIQIVNDDIYFYTGDGVDNHAYTIMNEVIYGQWHHLICKQNSTFAKECYLDGVSSGSVQSSLSTVYNTTNYLDIGVTDEGSTRIFDGSIDKVEIWNQSLSAEDIVNLYVDGRKSTNQRNSSFMVSQYLFDDTTMLNAFDSAGVNNGTFQGDANYSYDVVGLAGYWNFDGEKDNTEGLTYIDWSINSNDGTGTGNAVSNSTDCIYGNCVHLDGDGDYIALPADEDNIESGNGMTISAWINPDALGSSMRIMMKGVFGIGAGEGDWAFSAGSSSQLEFEKSFSTTTLFSGTSANTLNLNKWQHVVIAWDGSAEANNVNIYINGTEASYSTQTDGVGNKDSDAGVSWTIGAAGTASREFDGTIDEVMVFNAFLNATQITDIYNNQSARFVNEGTQRVRAVNITNTTTWDDNGFNRANLTTEIVNVHDSQVPARIGQMNMSVDPIDLELYMPFEWGAANDISGNGNDGVLFGDTFFNETGGLNQTGGFEFDVDGDFIDLNTEFNEIEFDVTVSLWINNDALGLYYLLDNTNGVTGFAIRLFADDLSFWAYSGGVSGITHDSFTTTNEWRHIVGVHNTTANVVFIDGVKQTPVNYDGSGGITDSIEVLTIGADYTGANEFDGSIDNVMIFNRSLSDAEVINIYNNQIQNGSAIYGYTDYQNITSGVEYEFNISTEADFLLPDYIMWAGNNSIPFSSPVIKGDILVEPFNVIEGDNPPTSNSPADASYEVGATATVGWTLSDDIAGSMYNVTRNSTIQNLSVSWTSGVAINVWVNTTTPAIGGQWNYTVFYNDSIGQSGVPDEVLITITAAAAQCWTEDMTANRIIIPTSCKYFTNTKDVVGG